MFKKIQKVCIFFLIFGLIFKEKSGVFEQYSFDFWPFASHKTENFPGPSQFRGWSRGSEPPPSRLPIYTWCWCLQWEVFQKALKSFETVEWWFSDPWQTSPLEKQLSSHTPFHTSPLQFFSPFFLGPLPPWSRCPKSWLCCCKVFFIYFPSSSLSLIIIGFFRCRLRIFFLTGLAFMLDPWLQSRHNGGSRAGYFFFLLAEGPTYGPL